MYELQMVLKQLEIGFAIWRRRPKYVILVWERREKYSKKETRSYSKKELISINPANYL